MLKSFEILFIPSISVFPILDQSNTQQKRIFTVKRQYYTPLNYKPTVRNQWVSPKMAAKGQIIVKCGLCIYLAIFAEQKTLS